MKTFLLLALSVCMIGCKAQAQTLCGPNHDQQCIAGGEPKAACGEYEHDVSIHALTNCHPVPEDQTGVLVQCEPTPPICEDDAHFVTEKQWKALEHAIELLKKMNLLEEEQIKLITGQKPSPREPKP